MKFNLSVVNIISDAHKDAINLIAEAYGCGANNLSVALIDSNGAIYWGCHSWMLDGDAQENWQAALAFKGLSVVQE